MTYAILAENAEKSQLLRLALNISLKSWAFLIGCIFYQEPDPLLSDQPFSACFRFRWAVLSMSLIRLSWLTSDAPGS